MFSLEKNFSSILINEKCCTISLHFHLYTVTYEIIVELGRDWSLVTGHPRNDILFDVIHRRIVGFLTVFGSSRHFSGRWLFVQWHFFFRTLLIPWHFFLFDSDVGRLRLQCRFGRCLGRNALNKNKKQLTYFSIFIIYPILSRNGRKNKK